MCRTPGINLCKNCESKIVRNLRSIAVAGVHLWSGALYGEELAQLILMAKEHNNLQARNFLVQLLVESFMRAQRDIGVEPPYLFIPIPSSRSANRVRGYRHAYLLAQGVAARLRKTQGDNFLVKELLVVNRKTADQSNLNRAQRAQNLQGAYSIAKSHDPKKIDSGRAQIFLLDDLLTTGASTGEGLRALQEAGFTPRGALTAGVSPRLFS